MTAAEYRAELDAVTQSGMLKIKQVAAYTGLSYDAARDVVMAHGGRKFGSTWRIAKPEFARYLASGKR
jgi:hypothetical protein